MKRRAFVFLGLALVAAGLARPQSGGVAFTHVTVIDVEAGRALPGMTVVVAGNRIAAVGSDATLRPPAGARVIDATGRFLIPGLWDMHVHAAFPGIDSQFLPLLLANGVTGVREMFSRLDWVDSTRKRLARGDYPGPRMIASGHILDGVPPIWPSSSGVRNAEEARRTVDSLAAAGAQFLKVYSRLSREAFFAAVRAAKARGLPVAGHVPSLVRVSEASDSGQKSIEHTTGLLTACSTLEDRLLSELDAAVRSPRGWDSAGVASRATTPELLAAYSPERCRTVARILVNNRTWMVPTMTVLHSVAYLDDSTLARDPRLRYIPAAWKQGWNPRTDFRFRMLTPADWETRKAAYRRQLEIITLLHREGVPFLAGTDLANPYIFPGFSLHDELANLVAVGFSPLEALRAATLNPARYFAATDSLGTIGAGKLADLVLLAANPLEDIRNTTRIEAVVANGRVYDRAALQKLVAARALP